MKSLIEELKRRHVFRIGIAYLVVAWLIIQLVNNVAGPLHLPDWTPTLIIVLLAIGFPVALVIAWAFELTPGGVKRTDTLDGTATEPQAVTGGRKLGYAIIDVLALGYFAWDRFGDEGVKPSPSGTPSVAVLAFEDLSPNHDQVYFADGVSEEILNALARIPDLKVTARTSSFYFKDKNADLKTIGDKLGVENILEGSVRKDGDNLRITAQLNNAQTGYHLWSRTYDRKLEDIFAIQEEIAKSVSEAIGISLGVGEAGRLPGMTRNPRAYDEFLLAQETEGPTAEASRTAIGHYQRAVEIDPEFGLAWLNLAGSYFVAELDTPGEIPDAIEKSSTSFDRARELTPDSPYLFVFAAFKASTTRDFVEANRQFEKALDAARKYSLERNIESAYANYLRGIGQFQAAAGYFERIAAVDPLNMNASRLLVEAYTILGETGKALAEANRGMALDGLSLQRRGFANEALTAALQSGDKGEIRKRVKLLQEVGNGDPSINALHSRMVALLDDADAALTELRRLVPDMSSNIDLAYNMSRWAAYFGAPALALECFNAMPKAANAIGGYRTFMPLFRDVRQLPGYKDFLRSTGLVNHWRETGKWADYCHPVGENDFECK